MNQGSRQAADGAYFITDHLIAGIQVDAEKIFPVQPPHLWEQEREGGFGAVDTPAFRTALSHQHDPYLHAPGSFPPLANVSVFVSVCHPETSNSVMPRQRTPARVLIGFPTENTAQTNANKNRQRVWD